MLMFKAFLDPLARSVWSGRWFVDGARALPGLAVAAQRLDIDLDAMESVAAAADESLWITQPAVAYLASARTPSARH
jgi:hypothetical protein